MPTAKERYEAATKYVERAIAKVEMPPITAGVIPLLGGIEAYAGHLKTEAARNDLAHIEARWLRATSDDERTRIARDAELLADRVQESLPGAPQDRARTNLYKGEIQTSAPATSYGQEVGRQAEEMWHWAKHAAGGIADEAREIGKWLLFGGGLVLAIKVVGLVRENQRRNERRVPLRRLINARLVEAANASEDMQ